MRMLAALMVSMLLLTSLLLTSGLLTRALVGDQQMPSSRPAPAARDVSDERARQLLVVRGR